MSGHATDRFLKPKTLFQHFYDFVGAPLRMVLLPDSTSRQLRFTSLQDERMRAVLPHIKGKLLDIGAGDNFLVNTYEDGVGVDVHDLGGGTMIVEDTSQLPFDDNSFDTITFLACLNHIPNRQSVLQESHRVLKPGGRVVSTMISPFIGTVGHAIWWYSEEKHREMAEGEKPGLSPSEMRCLHENAGFVDFEEAGFFYGLNRLYLATKCADSKR